MKFRLLQGVHIDTAGRIYTKNDIVESDTDLAAQFVNKFRMTDAYSKKIKFEEVEVDLSAPAPALDPAAAEHPSDEADIETLAQAEVDAELEELANRVDNVVERIKVPDLSVKHFGKGRWNIVDKDGNKQCEDWLRSKGEATRELERALRNG